MKNSSWCHGTAHGRRNCPFLSKLTAVMLFALAGLLVPDLVFVSRADERREASVPMHETGPVYSADKLVGTMNSGNLSGAVFENASGEQKFYRKNVTFSDGSRIIAVSSESIVVRTPEGSSLEYLVTRGTAGRSVNMPLAPSAVEPPPPAVPRNKDEGQLRKRIKGVRKDRNSAGQEP